MEGWSAYALPSLALAERTHVGAGDLGPGRDLTYSFGCCAKELGSFSCRMHRKNCGGLNESSELNRVTGGLHKEFGGWRKVIGLVSGTDR